jgi:hypothetical protein
MATYDNMSAVERLQLMEALGSLTGLQEGPQEQFPDGTHYEFDPDLKSTVEVTPLGERFAVALVAGKLQRQSEKAGRYIDQSASADDFGKEVHR